MSEIDLARPICTAERRSSLFEMPGVDIDEANQGSAGKRLTVVVHSKAEVPERLKENIDHGVIYIQDQSEPGQTGVGIVFVILQPYQEGSAQSAASKQEEIRVLSVDPNGPSDQVKCHGFGCSCK